MFVVDALVDARHAAVFVAPFRGGGEEAIDVGVGPGSVADGEGVDDAAEGLGRGGAEGGAGDEAVNAGDAEALEQPFVVSEEEGPVLDDGPAEIRAELVQAEGRGIGAIKGAARIEGAVAEEFVGRAVELVRAGF